jgi:hypothetical protein
VPFLERVPTPPENKVERDVLFFAAEKRPPTHQLYHAFHHNFTTKTPHQTRAFCQNPQQKATFHHAKKKQQL